MARKRKSDPLPSRKFKNISSLLRLPSSEDTSSSADQSTPGEELEKLISVIHEKFKRKTKEQEERSAEHLKNTISDTVESIKKQVDKSKQLEQLKSNLGKVVEERTKQVTLFKQRYRELKDGMSSLIKSIETYDDQFDAFVEGFVNAVQSIETNIHESTCEALAIVPSTVTSSSKSKRQKK